MPFITLIIFGALSAGFALILEGVAISLPGIADSSFTALSPTSFVGDFSLAVFGFFVLVALIEETSKYLFLRQYLLRFAAPRPSLDDAWPWVGLVFGGGYAAVEIALALKGDVTPPLPLLGGILLLQLATSLALARLLRRPRYARFLAALPLILALTAAHTLYNLAVFLFS